MEIVPTLPAQIPAASGALSRGSRPALELAAPRKRPIWEVPMGTNSLFGLSRSPAAPLMATDVSAVSVGLIADALPPQVARFELFTA